MQDPFNDSKKAATPTSERHSHSHQKYSDLIVHGSNFANEFSYLWSGFDQIWCSELFIFFP